MFGADSIKGANTRIRSMVRFWARATGEISLAYLGLSIFPACGDSSSSGPGNDNVARVGPEGAAFIAAYAHAACDELAKCCSVYHQPLRLDACIEQAKGGRTALALLAAGTDFEDPAFNAEQAAACLEAARGATRNCSGGEPGARWRAICDQVFTAPRGPGEPCGGAIKAEVQCKPPPGAKGRGECRGGICEWVLLANEGDPCVEQPAGEHQRLECNASLNLSCDSAEGICKQSPAGGCDFRPCPSGYACHAGSCQSTSPPSDSCGGCANGLLCDAASGSCRNAAELGQDCSNAVCVAGTFCVKGGPGSLVECSGSDRCYKCANGVKEDEYCDPDGVFFPCAQGLHCVASATSQYRCVRQLAVGNPCQEDAECATGYCAGGRCALAGGKAGSGCEEISDCNIGLDCFHNTCTPPTPIGGNCDGDLPRCVEGAQCASIDHVTAANGCLPRDIPTLCWSATE